MQLDFLRPLYSAQSPYASVYLDVSRDTEGAPSQIALRKRDVLAELGAAGCDGATLAALDQALAAEPRHERGQAAFACAGAVRFGHWLPAPPERQIARFALLPDLMPLLAQMPPPLTQVLVHADRTGGEVVSIEAGDTNATTMTGPGWPVHRTSLGGWSQARFQRSVDHAWELNAGELADLVSATAARTRAEVIVIAGDVRARTLLLDRLPQPVQDSAVVVDAEVGASSEQVLTAGEGAARGRTDDRTRLVLDRLHRGLGRGQAVAGLGAALAALRDRLVSDVVIANDPSSAATAWIGPAGTDVAASRAELHERGVEQLVRDRADAAIVRACAVTGAELHLLPADMEPPAGGIGALLRYAAGS